MFPTTNLSKSRSHSTSRPISSSSHASNHPPGSLRQSPRAEIQPSPEHSTHIIATPSLIPDRSQPDELETHPVMASSPIPTAHERPGSSSVRVRPVQVEIRLNSTPRPSAFMRLPPPEADELSEDQLITSDVTPVGRTRPGQDHAPRNGHSKTLPHTEKIAQAPTPAPKAQGTPITQVSHRGRPRGWKPGMTYREIRGQEPLPPSARKPATLRTGLHRGRRGRGAKVTPRVIYENLKPAYIPFLCEWTGCPAQLQNVETLRKHLVVVHGGVGAGPLVCKWAKCARLDPLPAFQDEHDFEEHVKQRHLVPLVWHMGEGFGNTDVSFVDDTMDGDGDNLPSYLFDSHGEQVTPSVKDQQVEDLASWRDRRRRLNDLLVLQQKNARSDSEDEGEQDEDIMMNEVPLLGGSGIKHWQSG